MAVEAIIQDVEGVVELAIKSGSQVKRGDILGYSSGWLQADADAAGRIPGKYVALGTLLGDGVAKIKACRRCTFTDEDAPYTADTMQYLSGTAGEVTETRPATDGDLIQVVGESLDTKQLRIELGKTKELEVFIPVGVFNALNAGAVEAHIVDPTTGEWVGPDADSALVAAVFTGRMPSGMVSLLAAKLIVNTMAATALDIDVAYVSAHDGAANTGDAGAAQTALTSETTTGDDKVHAVDISAGMDADFLAPGRNFGIEIDPDAGDFLVLGLYLRWKVVD